MVHCLFPCAALSLGSSESMFCLWSTATWDVALDLLNCSCLKGFGLREMQMKRHHKGTNGCYCSSEWSKSYSLSFCDLRLFMSSTSSQFWRTYLGIFLLSSLLDLVQKITKDRGLSNDRIPRIIPVLVILMFEMMIRSKTGNPKVDRWFRMLCDRAAYIELRLPTINLHRENWRSQVFLL